MSVYVLIRNIQVEKSNGRQEVKQDMIKLLVILATLEVLSIVFIFVCDKTAKTEERGC